MKKRHSLKTLLPLTAVLISTTFIVVSLVTCYLVFKNNIQKYYSDYVSNAGCTMAARVDAEAVERVEKVLESDSYYQLWLNYQENEDAGPLITYLTDKDVYEDYLSVMEFVSQMRDDLGVTYAYIIDVQEDCTYYILDPDEGFEVAGWRPENSQEFREYTSNVRIQPTINRSIYGWLMSGYEPLVNSRGKAIALVGIDFSMNEIMKDLDTFMKGLTAAMIALLIVFLVLVIFLVTRGIIEPIEKLKDATAEFIDNDNSEKIYEVMDFDIKSRSEIRELYDSIKMMEEDIVSYVKNITEITTEKERIGAELNIASNIQKTMLPTPLKGESSIDIFAFMEPAKEVGGDFYDFFMIDDNHLAVVIADVSGKGIPASLFMVVGKTLLEQCTEVGLDLGRTFEKVNRRLCKDNEEGMFITAFEGILDLNTGLFEYVNAGHQLPFVCRRDGRFIELTAKTGFVLGGFQNTHYESEKIVLSPGDKVFAFTDGVTDSESEPEKFFGMERLVEALDKLKKNTPEEIIDGINAELDKFVGPEDQFDDITMLCFEYKGR